MGLGQRGILLEKDLQLKGFPGFPSDVTQALQHARVGRLPRSNGRGNRGGT